MADLVPGAGRLVHMPSHIYWRVGRYNDASEANIRAARVDDAYIAAAIASFEKAVVIQDVLPQTEGRRKRLPTRPRIEVRDHMGEGRYHIERIAIPANHEFVAMQKIGEKT